MRVTQNNIPNLEQLYEINAIESELRGVVYFIDPKAKKDGIVVCKTQNKTTRMMQIKASELKKLAEELNAIYKIYFG